MNKAAKFDVRAMNVGWFDEEGGDDEHSGVSLVTITDYLRWRTIFLYGAVPFDKV